MKYMVMECHPGYVILLDEQGRIQKAANFHYQVGQLVENPVFMNEYVADKEKRWIFRGAAIVAACLTLFWGLGYYRSYKVVYSSIYMSINPEIQIDLNKKGKIIRLTGLNEDGKILLEGYQEKGKDKEIVVNDLIDQAMDMGYLTAGGKVEFSIDTPDHTNFQTYSLEIEKEIKKHLEGKEEVSVKIKNCRTKEWFHEEEDSDDDEKEVDDEELDIQDEEQDDESDDATEEKEEIEMERELNPENVQNEEHEIDHESEPDDQEDEKND